VVRGTHYAAEIHYCNMVADNGPLALVSAFTVCPNKACGKVTVDVTLRSWDTLPRSTIPVLGDTLGTWQWVPPEPEAADNPET